jgi:hypothetical protein
MPATYPAHLSVVEQSLITIYIISYNDKQSHVVNVRENGTAKYVKSFKANDISGNYRTDKRLIHPETSGLESGRRTLYLSHNILREIKIFTCILLTATKRTSSAERSSAERSWLYLYFREYLWW